MQMFDPSQNLSFIRIIFGTFIKVWHAMCGFMILFGLFMFVLGLAAVFNFKPFDMQVAEDAGPGFFYGSFFCVAVGIGFCFLGRIWYRSFLTRIEGIDNQQQQSSDKRPGPSCCDAQKVIQASTVLFIGVLASPCNKAGIFQVKY
jgi:hypothetical protein